MQDANLWKFCIFERRFGTETDGQTLGSRYSVKKVIIIWVNLSENYVLKFARVLNAKISALARKTQFPLLVSHTKNSYLKITMSMPLVSLAFFQIASSAIF
jgi:hypothetical protein